MCITRYLNVAVWRWSISYGYSLNVLQSNFLHVTCVACGRILRCIKYMNRFSSFHFQFAFLFEVTFSLSFCFSFLFALGAIHCIGQGLGSPQGVLWPHFAAMPTLLILSSYTESCNCILKCFTKMKAYRWLTPCVHRYDTIRYPQITLALNPEQIWLHQWQHFW